MFWLQPPDEHDPQSQLHLEREWRFERNSKVRREAAKQQARTGKVLFSRGLANQLGNKINCFPRHHSLSVKCFTRHEENECVMESSWEPLGGRCWHVHWCMQTFVSWLLLRTELSYTVSKKRERKSGNLRIIQGWKKLWFLKLKRMLV